MKTYGIIARFDTTSDLLHAAEKIRDAGFKDFDCHSPFPVHGLDAVSYTHLTLPTICTV